MTTPVVRVWPFTKWLKNALLISGRLAFLQECVGGGKVKWAIFKWMPLERLSEPTHPIYSFTCHAMLATQIWKIWTWLFTTQRCFLGPCDILLPKTRKSQRHQQSWPPKKLHHQPSWPCLPLLPIKVMTNSGSALSLASRNLRHWQIEWNQ